MGDVELDAPDVVRFIHGLHIHAICEWRSVKGGTKRTVQVLAHILRVSENEAAEILDRATARVEELDAAEPF